MKTTFSVESLLGIKHGFASMILKQNSKQIIWPIWPIKFKSERSVNKIMAIIFRDSEGVVLIDFLEGQKTVTGASYVQVLRKLRAELAKKYSGKLHHDNASEHSARVTKVLREF